MSEIKITHRGIEITYNEARDCWNADIFGSPAESLMRAKEKIDAKLDREQKEPFKRVACYIESFQYDKGNWPTVTLTSVSDDLKSGWISFQGERLKINRYGDVAFNIYPVTPDNTKLVAEIKELQKQSGELEQKIKTTKQKLNGYKP